MWEDAVAAGEKVTGRLDGPCVRKNAGVKENHRGLHQHGAHGDIRDGQLSADMGPRTLARARESVGPCLASCFRPLLAHSDAVGRAGEAKRSVQLPLELCGHSGCLRWTSSAWKGYCRQMLLVSPLGNRAVHDPRIVHACYKSSPILGSSRENAEVAGTKAARALAPTVERASRWQLCQSESQ